MTDPQVLSSYDWFLHAAREQNATVHRYPGLGFLLLTNHDRHAEVWFTDTGRISRATTFNTPDDRKPVQGRHFRRQVMRWLRDGTRA